MARRPCKNVDGSWKRRYLTRKAAKKNCDKGYAAYPCSLHGEPVWHVGRTRYRPAGYLERSQEEETPGT